MILNDDRWYPLKKHPVQLDLINDNIRFKVVAAGRRSGKTERAKRFMIQECINHRGKYFIGAPTRDQVKRIYWDDVKELSFSSVFSRKPSETELTIWFPNGSTLTLLGMDNHERVKGIPWSGCIIDEIADVHPDAWEESIKPSLDTLNPLEPDRRSWCWLIGVPEGLNHFYDLAQQAKSGIDNWKFYTWKSSDILPLDVIEEAKRTLSPRQFKQQYEASFETTTGKIYEDYSQENWRQTRQGEQEALLWCHDFNYSPLSSAICVRRGDELFIVDEIVLESAVISQSCVEFIDRYKSHSNKKVIVYGDPAGKAGEKHGQVSNYVVIENMLKDAGWTVTRKVKAAAPAIRDRQNAVRAKILNALGERSLFVNNITAKYCDRGLATTQVKEGSTFIEKDSKYQHITTAIGYMVDYEWPISFKRQTPDFTPQPTKHFFNQ